MRNLSEKMIYKPLSIQFEITELCTHKCKPCYNYYSHNVNVSSTNRGVIEKIAEQDFFDITLTGGEPFCVRSQLYDSIKRFKKENMDVRVNSNLYLLTKDDAEKIIELKVDSILSSIFGPDKEIHDFLTGVDGSFEKLKKSLKYFENKNFGIAMNMVVNKQNLKKVYETSKFLYEQFGINYFCATPMVISPGKDLKNIEISREEYISILDTLLELEQNLKIKTDSLHPAVPCMFKEEEQEKYRRFFEGRACTAAQGTLTFSPQGNVRVCSHESRIYGNILDESLENILEKMREWRKGNHIPNGCSPCEYVGLCKGGCRVSAEAETGKLNGFEPYFTHPVKRRISTKEEKIIFEKLKIQKGNFRFREEQNNLTTVYLAPRMNSILTPIELKIFRRFLSGKNYPEILEEVKNEENLKEICTKLSIRKLLTNSA